MASDSAWNLGAEIARGNIAQRRQRQYDLQDEERRVKVTDLYSKGDALSKLIPSLSGEHRDRAMKALTDIEENIASIYHPDNNPGAVAKDWHLLKGLIEGKITGKKSQAPALTNISYDPAVTPDLTLTPGSQSAQPEATPATMLNLPSQPITLPGGRGVDVRPAPELMTREQRQHMATRDAARQKAELDVVAGLSPEEETEQASRKNLAYVTQGMKDFKRLNPNATPGEQTEHFNSLVAKAYGFPQEKPVWKEYQSPDGTKQWFDASRPDLIPSGWTAIAPGAARGGGSDFWKTVTAKYGLNPTAAQIEAERQQWVKLGAHGTETRTVVDAAGNSRSIRVPVFNPGQTVPEGLGLPADATVSGSATLPTDWPSDIEAPLAPARPSEAGTGTAPSTGTGAAAEAPVSAPPASIPVSPAEQQRLESLGLEAPTDPVITAPADPDDAKAALADARQLGIDKDVLAVAEYRMDPAQATAARGGQKTKFMQLVQRVNPAYDATKWNAVQQARKSFTAGGLDAKNMNSLGLSVNHLNKLVDTYDALDNTEFPDINKARNAARVHTGYGGVAAVDSAANAVSGEMATVFKNTSGTDQEIQSWREQFDHNMSPEAFEGSVDTMIELISGRLSNEAQNYVNTFGSLKGFPRLAPKTVKILKRFPDNEGAKLMLEVNREAAAASGRKLPADDSDQPTTAPPPPPKAQVNTGTSGGAAGTKAITLSHAMEIYKQNHPGEKNVSKQTVINDLKKYGQSYVDDLK